MPWQHDLLQTYPNPFNPRTTIRFSLVEPSHASLTVYDVLGTEMAVLLNGEVPPGEHRVTFDVSGLPGGVYFCT